MTHDDKINTGHWPRSRLCALMKRGPPARVLSLHGSQSDRLVALLDDVERRVQTMRDQATQVADERREITRRLCEVQDAVKHASFVGSDVEREEIHLTAENLVQRCLAVEVNVETPRNDAQEAALNVVEKRIEEITARDADDFQGIYEGVTALYNATLPDEARGAVDDRFQLMLMGCCAEDQKRIRRRLERMLSDMATAFNMKKDSND
ncbi:BAG family molecular chaperone regulator 2-like [Oscarella lobularis]|uniref:BAG family molecular chaperone regulator 2-like n=1 Tax=Oscarella lobularis TaxID=121494 RepID=UPI003313ACEE